LELNDFVGDILIDQVDVGSLDEKELKNQP